MQKPSVRLSSILGFFLLALGLAPAHAQKWQTLENTHYRVMYQKPYAQLAGEVLRIAESVWPTLAKAYDAYDRYQKIDILITDDGDEANGFAIYTSSRIAIFAPHMDWVMRNRQNWLGNVVTHELAHVFSLRRAAWLSPFDEVDIYGATYDYGSHVNYAFHLPWIPLVAPTWYVEGIAQFEATQNGNDSWDSQRDMVLRDAYLTGTLPTLDFIETFDEDVDWTQGERTYNTGFAFLLYLKDRFGVDKVRSLAWPKPIFNFSYSVEKAFGKSLPELFEEFKRSLANRYADYKELPKDPLADPDMVGNYQQNLAFSSDGRYMAWLGNDEDRRYPLNWIYWKEIGGGKASKADKPQMEPAQPAPASPAPKKENLQGKPEGYAPMGLPDFSAAFPSLPANPALAAGRRNLPVAGFGARWRAPQRAIDNRDPARSDEMGSAGLEFNHDNTRLLTTRGADNSIYTDIWEYEFKGKGWESDKWHRITWEERAGYPSYHPFKNLIVFTRKFGGTTNIAVLDSTGKVVRLTNFSNGEQVYNPRYTPKGDSIYFTLGLVDKEAIAAISADVQGFDTFGSLKDSAIYPDSLTLPKNQKFTFVTPLKRGAIRNLRFSGDTLLWSSNIEDSVYNVYARIPGDNQMYRATRVAGQALEPLVHNGQLYYQGYNRQRFQILKEPLSLTKTGVVLARPSDSLMTTKPKKEDFTKAFESGDATGVKVALDITPFIAVQPQFITGAQSYTDLAVGLNVTLGEGYGGWMQGFSGSVSKRWDYQTPLSYQLSYSGFIAEQPIAHTRFTWPVDLYYSYSHSNLHYENTGVFPTSPTSTTTVYFQDVYKRDMVDAVVPLPVLTTRPYHQMWVDGQFWRETIDEDIRIHIDSTGAGGAHFTNDSPRLSWLRDAPDHKHYSTGFNWWWGRGMVGTYLPTGVSLNFDIHKWWATYDTSSLFIDTAHAVSLSLEGKPVPALVLQQDQFDPWSVGGAAHGVWSYRKYFSVFANLEGGAYLNTFPTQQRAADVNGATVTTVDNAAGSLWPMTYRLGFYRLSGYPYSFVYRGRDIMEGSSFGLGQCGLSVPIPAGAFLPGLPLTSFKQLMATVIGEGGTTLLTAPDHIFRSLEEDKYYPLVDVGFRLSANFRLYHELPLTVFGQVFVPFNDLKASDLLPLDYPQISANDKANRDSYMHLVKDPRFFVGFELGYF